MDDIPHPASVTPPPPRPGVIPTQRLVGTLQLVCAGRTRLGRPRTPWYAVVVLDAHRDRLKVRPVAGHGVGWVQAVRVVRGEEVEAWG